MPGIRTHGELSAGDVGELVGVSGTTIGQWARHGLIAASVSGELPHVYAVEDVGEASIVAELLRRGVRHAEVRSAIEHLPGPWPLTGVELATTVEDGTRRRPRLVLDSGFALDDRGWQKLAVLPPMQALAVRLRR